MIQYRKKPVVVEAITFDGLVEYGRNHGANIVNGMPWSFNYNTSYLIPTLEGMMRMDRGDMLITGVKGEIYPCKPDIFAATYEPADTPDLASLLGVPPEKVRGRVEELLWIKDHATALEVSDEIHAFIIDGGPDWKTSKPQSGYLPDILAAVAALREPEQKERGQ